MSELEELPITEIEGIGSARAKTLREKGIETVHDMFIQETAEIAELCNISKETVDKYKTEARHILQGKGIIQADFVTATQALERRKALLRCTTGSKELDKLLGDGMGHDGIETGAVTEFSGEFGSGKSQICHQLCVNCQLPIDENGLAAGAIVLDTEGTFRPERIQQIAQAKGLDPQQIGDNVIQARIYNASHLELLVKDIHKTMRQHNAKLLIVDSIIALHRAEFTGRGVLAERQERLASILHKLVRISELHSIATVITNQVVSNPDANYPGAPQFKPVGGNIVGHTSTYRIFLRKSTHNRIARMLDSPYHAYGECRFTVNETGITDVEE